MFGRHHGIGLEGDHSNDTSRGIGIVTRCRFMRCILNKLCAGMSRGGVLSGRYRISRRFGTGYLRFEEGGQGALGPFGGGGRFFFGG